jgi:hypothetical protein
MYKDIKQIVFASMLFGITSEDVKRRRTSSGDCANDYRQQLSRTLDFVVAKPNPGSAAKPESSVPQPSR